jgi:hypothetical protein
MGVVPPLPTCVDDLKQRITVAAATVDMSMLRSIWEELDYRIDICHVTKGSHIEHLQLSHVNFRTYPSNHLSISAMPLKLFFL